MSSDKEQQSQANSSGTPNVSLSPTLILEPVSMTVPEYVPWYKRILGGNTRTQTVWKLSFIMMLLITALVIMKIHQPQTIVTKADVSHALVTLFPSTVNLPPDAFIQLWVTTDVALTRGQFEISFDPTKISITDARLPNGSPLGDVTVTTTERANAVGKMFIVFSPSATHIVSPKRTFELINITFHSKFPATNASTKVNLVSDGTKLYHEKMPLIITGVSAVTLILGAGK